MMPRMLFVDDEPLVLNGLRRMLRGRRNEWDINFAESGQEALAALADAPFDIVVSDMRMPEMSGDLLLREVAEHHPGCARLILSGHAELDSILDAVSPAHQYHAKPCDMTVLERSLTHILDSMDSELDDAIRLRLTGARHLPSGEQAYRELSDHLERSVPDPEATLKIVASDIALTAQVLRLVNTAFFGKPVATLDLKHALDVLGFDLLRRLRFESGIFRTAETAAQERTVGTLNDVAQQRAHAICETAAAGGISELVAEQARTAAVLSYAGLLAAAESDRPTDFADRDRYAAVLLALWGVAPDLVAAVTQRPAPKDSNSNGIAELLRMTRVQGEDARP